MAKPRDSRYCLTPSKPGRACEVGPPCSIITTGGFPAPVGARGVYSSP